MSDPRPAIFPSMDAPATTPAWLDANRAAKVRSLFEPEPEEEHGREQHPPSVAPGRDRRSELAPSIPPPAPPPTAAARRQVEHEPGAADPAQTLDVPLDERVLSRLPPPPGLGSLIPGARSAPPPANDTGYAVLREHADAFANAAIELALARAATITVLEGQLLDLSIEIASALIERAVELEPALHAALARAALSSLGDATAVTLRTSPDAFGPVCQVLGGEDCEVRGVRVHVAADSAIPGLGCVVDGENMRVDATVSERLRAVRRAFEEERRKTAESSE
jgi:hypothetical protein